MNESIPDPASATPTASNATREQVAASFTAGTPDAIRDRVLDAVFAVLNGDDDD
jgi:hypothetical protein